MGVPTSEVGYTPAMPRREDHEVHKRTCGGIEIKHSRQDPTLRFFSRVHTGSGLEPASYAMSAMTPSPSQAA